jgi:hypothetical protein
MPRSVLLIVIGLAALITGPVHAQTAANKPAIANQRLSEWERAKVETMPRAVLSRPIRGASRRKVVFICKGPARYALPMTRHRAFWSCLTAIMCRSPIAA